MNVVKLTSNEGCNVLASITGSCGIPSCATNTLTNCSSCIVSCTVHGTLTTKSGVGYVSFICSQRTSCNSNISHHAYSSYHTNLLQALLSMHMHTFTNSKCLIVLVSRSTCTYWILFARSNIITFPFQTSNCCGISFAYTVSTVCTATVFFP